MDNHDILYYSSVVPSAEVKLNNFKVLYILPTVHVKNCCLICCFSVSYF